ncbi:unnamed protein product [Amoebophrya sp. A25]|nr:unnamed protein product [Amoebophrya sp. A25]|eukprot:GSA25T00027601001.1
MEMLQTKDVADPGLRIPSGRLFLFNYGPWQSLLFSCLPTKVSIFVTVILIYHSYLSYFLSIIANDNYIDAITVMLVSLLRFVFEDVTDRPSPHFCSIVSSYVFFFNAVNVRQVVN